MKNRIVLGALFALGVSALSGCSSNEGTGAVIGSLVGAGIGKSTANHTDERAAIGAVVGGMVGAAVGAQRDKQVVQAGTATVAQSASVAQYANNQPQYVYVDRPSPVRSTIVYRTGGYNRGNHRRYYKRHNNRYYNHRNNRYYYKQHR